MPKKKKAAWSYCVGERGRNRVRAFADPRRNSLIFLEWRNAGKRQRLSLGHSDTQRAKEQADKLSSEYQAACAAPPKPVEERLTLQTLFDTYLVERTPDKGPLKQQHDRSCADMFQRFFGSTREVHTLARQDWDRFIRERRAGRIYPALWRTGKGKRKPPTSVRNRVIEYDLKFLLSVFNWATVAGDGKGGALLDRNPLRGFPLPKEKSPSRAVITSEEYEALLETAPALGWRCEVLLILAHETGHRIGAIRQLRWKDIDLERGLVVWSEQSDKGKREHVGPLTQTAVDALRRAQKASKGIGKAFVFPSLSSASKPVSREFALSLWERLEKSAGIQHRPRQGFHSLRRLFATDLKGLPTRDLMALGGWVSEQTLIRCYTAPASVDEQREILARRALKVG